MRCRASSTSGFVSVPRVAACCRRPSLVQCPHAPLQHDEPCRRHAWWRPGQHVKPQHVGGAAVAHGRWPRQHEWPGPGWHAVTAALLPNRAWGLFLAKPSVVHHVHGEQHLATGGSSKRKLVVSCTLCFLLEKDTKLGETCSRRANFVCQPGSEFVDTPTHRHHAYQACLICALAPPTTPLAQGSSHVFRSHRSPASLQQLWTWSCSLTEGRPVSSLAWNSANNNLLAAGYSSRPAAQDPESTAAGAAAGQAGGGGGGVAGAPVSAFAQVQQGGSSMVGQGALLAAPRDGSLDAPAGVADSADAAGGCVALWSLKNQFHPVWSFTTQAGR